MSQKEGLLLSKIVNELSNIEAMKADEQVKENTEQLFESIVKYRYTYNFNWLGRPIIQLPQDLIALQEIIWETKPELIIETGIAHGGSLIFYASMLELIGGNREILGIDIDIRQHNRKEIEAHPLYKKIKMIEGSSISDEVATKVYDFAKEKKNVMVVLDSSHTHDHVLKELHIYSQFVTKDSYLVVFDTAIEDLPEGLYTDKPWGKGNNPKTAVWQFLKETDRFEVDKELENKLLITVAPDGYLKCIKE